MRAPNGKLIVGIVEQMYGLALITDESTIDDIEYSGETKVDWDSQELFVNGEGDCVFLDEDGYRWTESQLSDLEDAPVQEETE